MLDSIYEELDFLNENNNDNQEEDLTLDEVKEEIQITDEVLDVETSISLDLWVFIEILFFQILLVYHIKVKMKKIGIQKN